MAASVRGASLKDVVQRIGMLRWAGSFRGDQVEIECNRDPARNLVLQGEQLARLAIKPLRPEMCVGLGVDQLGVDADLIARPADAAFEYIAHTQLAPNLLGVDG